MHCSLCCTLPSILCIIFLLSSHPPSQNPVGNGISESPQSAFCHPSLPGLPGTLPAAAAAPSGSASCLQSTPCNHRLLVLGRQCHHWGSAEAEAPAGKRQVRRGSASFVQPPTTVALASVAGIQPFQTSRHTNLSMKHMHSGGEQERCLLWRVRSEGSASSTCPLSLSSWGSSLPTGSTEKSCRRGQGDSAAYQHPVSRCSTRAAWGSCRAP